MIHWYVYNPCKLCCATSTNVNPTYISSIVPGNLLLFPCMYKNELNDVNYAQNAPSQHTYIANQGCKLEELTKMTGHHNAKYAQSM